MSTMTDFHGLPTRSIANAHLQIDFLAEAGPRLVRLFLADSTGNLLAETPDRHWRDRFGEYYLRGGHRLAIAPEALGLSYVPDDAGLIVEEIAGGVRLIRPTEIGSRVSKCLEIYLQPDRPAVTLRHFVQNDGDEPLSIAPWGVTQLRLGGIAVLPLRLPIVSERSQPDRQVVLWPYASWRDARLFAADDYLWIDAQPHPLEFKIGALSCGWLGYLNQGVFFLKRFDPQLKLPHPDLNTNAQLYCNQRYLELESLGPLTRLEPGQSSTHLETWELYRAEDVPHSIAGLRDWMRQGLKSLHWTTEGVATKIGRQSHRETL